MKQKGDQDKKKKKDSSRTRSTFSIDERIYKYPDDTEIIIEELKKAKTRYAKKDYETKERIYYYNIPAAFDIEDSSFRIHVPGEDKEEKKNGGRKFSTMYVWQFAINGKCIIGRTWPEFLRLCSQIEEYTSQNKRLIIYIHFLNHEFSFFQKYFEWQKVFCKAERSPIFATTTTGLEFRDSYILTGKSLQKSAEDLQKYKIKKLSGDLDYNLIRGSKTPLTDKELGYCSHDVLALNAVIQEKIESEKKGIAGIPLTNTGYVRRYLKRCCYPYGRENAGNREIYRMKMRELIMTPEDYLFYREAFAGGFTHGNALYIGDHIHGRIDSDDFTSSYPAVCLSELFPMSYPDIYYGLDKKEFLKFYNDPSRLMIFAVKFTGLKMKNNVYENPISESKCQKLINPCSSNGRIVSADILETVITNVDFSYIRKFYDWESISIGKSYIFYGAYLPKPIIKAILKLYQDKTKLKGVAGKEVEYMISKGMLNSCYGCMVTDPVKDEIIYNNDDGWDTNPADLNEAIDHYNKSKNRFLFYPWGIFVTAYARRNLFTGIYELGRDYIYADTDSVKYINREKHVDYFWNYNLNITKKIRAVLTYYNIDPDQAAPETIKGEKKQIGVWDWETGKDFYTDFKTLGAKRYIYTQDGKLHITIAGLSKKDGCRYIGKQKDPYEFFNDEMTIPKENSGRLTHTYIDEPEDGLLTDYNNVKMEFHELTSVHLEPAEFTLSITKQFLDYVGGFKDEVLYP